MPAAKPTTLNNRNDTKDDREKRAAAESAMRPRTKLTVAVPAGLRGHKEAAAIWKRTIRLYNEVDGEIATSFDRDLLIKYCLLEQEVVELAFMRTAMRNDWESNQEAAKKIKPNPDTLEDWVKMWNIVNAMFQRFQGMDARLDGKRKLLLSISQALYLTPRSRAGVAPPTKEAEKPKSAMGDLLD